MTEPTNHLRADVSAQLDIVIAGILANVGLDDLEEARERLRAALSSAWSQGWQAGWDEGAHYTGAHKNPYHRTDIL